MQLMLLLVFGVTVLRGIGGYGSSSVYHTEKILRLSQDLPIIIEVGEYPERIGRYCRNWMK